MGIDGDAWDPNGILRDFTQVGYKGGAEPIPDWPVAHAVDFGTSPNPVFQGNQNGTTFDPGILANSTTYYWAIDEVNSSGTNAGPVWSFTTEAPPPRLGKVLAVIKSLLETPEY